MPCLTEVIAALMWSPKTRADLIAYTGCKESSVDTAIKALHRSGIIYRAGITPHPLREDGTLSSGCRPVIWAMQAKPFAARDAVSPKGRALVALMADV